MRTDENYGAKLLLPVALLAIAAFLFRELVDADTWWQVGIGRDILARLDVPAVDRFSIAGWGLPYHDSHWLFQLVVALVDRIGGMAGVTLFASALWGAAFYGVYRGIRPWCPPSFAAILVFVVAIACSDRFTPRPDLVTCLMIPLFYNCLQSPRFGRRDILLLIVLQACWSNSHGLFVIGPFMVGCYAVPALCAIRTDPSGAAMKASALAGVLLASVLTPFGVDGWRYALLIASEAGPGGPSLFRRITELQPTFGNLALPDVWAYSLLLLLTWGGAAFALSRRKISLPRLLIVAGLFAASLTGRRSIPLFVLAAAPFMVEQLSLSSIELKMKKPAVWGVAALMLACSYFPLSGSYYHWLDYPQRFGAGPSPSLYPLAFPAFLKDSGFRGRIYNGNILGGFLLYHGQIPLVDGRWEIYKPKDLERIFAASGDNRLWELLVSQYGIRGVLLPHLGAESAPLLPRIAADRRWKLVYLDHAASFWVWHESAERLPAIDTARPLQLDPGNSRTDDYYSLASFYKAVGAFNAAEKTAVAGLTGKGYRERLLGILGSAQRDAGRMAAAEQTFLTLYREKPENLQALNELAFFAYLRGDRAAARSFLIRGAALAPGDREVRANLERIERELAGR